MTRPGTVARINAALTKLGRDERLVRGRGYFYLRGGEASAWPSSSIYVAHLGPDDFEFAAREVEQVFEAGGVAITIPLD